MPTELPNDRAGPHQWICFGRFIYHNRQSSEFEECPNLHALTPGQSVGLLVTPNGQLHLFLDGKYCLEIATGLPVDTPLWGAADVFGRCTKIKSEIMSGESSGVVISPSQCVGEELD